MSQHVSPQVDVGGLTLRGLGAFSSILATLSTDDVAPTAMLQMERLGTFFPINGPKAARVPDLLQRCNSVRLDRLSLAIGWRKGDSASLMSESAGGQAVSLLCACIFSLFNDEDSSTILSYLCIRLLPLGTVCASMSQLHRVGTILSSKLHALGFGTLLAEQVMRVCNVYKQLEMAVPSDLLSSFSLDAAVDVLHALSRAVREPGVLVRIEGTSGMGYIIAIAMTMFVEDCLITVQGMILNSEARQSILIELGSAASQQGSCQISIEEILEGDRTVVLPIRSLHHELLTGRLLWPGHLAHELHLNFINVGLPGCPHEVLVASCDLLFALPCWTEDVFNGYGTTALPKGGLVALLGITPWHTMQQTWREVFCASPTLPRKDLKDAWSVFVRIFAGAISSVPCVCSKCNNEMWLRAERRTNSQSNCPTYKLWAKVERILNRGIWSVFINPGENVSGTLHYYRSILTDVLRKALTDYENLYMGCDSIYSAFTGTDLATVKESCVQYPTELVTLQKSSDFRLSFELTDGMLVYNGRYFRSLRSTAPSERDRARKSLVYKAKKIVPSNIGEHSRLTLTIREKLHTLELGAMVHGQARLTRINLRSILSASIGLTCSKPCEHGIEDALQPEYVSKVFITSIFEPRPIGKKQAIAQVKSNPTAQLLCCEPGVKCILQSECCLTCALKQAGNQQVIVITS